MSCLGLISLLKIDENRRGHLADQGLTDASRLRLPISITVFLLSPTSRPIRR